MLFQIRTPTFFVRLDILFEIRVVDAGIDGRLYIIDAVNV